MKGLGNLANIGQMFKQAQQMQKRMSALQEELAGQSITGTAGGGLVTVTMNGKSQVTSIKIDPEVVKPDDISLLEDLVLVACNDAQIRVQELVKTKMEEITGGIHIPGLMGGLPSSE
jgi:hypothetical protein